jgi:DNA polymerase-3 subunit gamma/tau
LRKQIKVTNKTEAPSVSIKSEETVKKPTPPTPPPMHGMTGTISIKSEMEAQRKQTSQPVGNLPREMVSHNDVKKFSRQYAHEVREAGKETFFHALIKRDPLLDDETITLTLDNQVQVEYIRPILQDFVNFLRKHLKNGFLEIKLHVIEDDTEVQKPVTGKDKFQAMARKNPNIHTLKNRFNLDIEY